MGGTTRKRTAGYTTTGTHGATNVDIQIINGIEVSVKPKPLMIKRGNEPKEKEEYKGSDAQHDGSQSGVSGQLDSNKSKDPNLADGTSGAKKTDDEKKKEAGSVNSQVTSSFVDTSEDEEAKRLAAEKEAKAKKKGLTPQELEMIIDVELTESKTMTLLHIPSTYVKQDTPEMHDTIEKNKIYEELKKSKIGSDLYNQRGTQTLNAAKKEKVLKPLEFSTDIAQVNSSNWEIADAQNQEDQTEAEIQEKAYFKSINDIMEENLKTPSCLFEGDSFATHISIITTKSGANIKESSAGQSMSNSSKGRIKGSKMQSSQSGLKASKNESEMASSMSGSMKEKSTQ